MLNLSYPRIARARARARDTTTISTRIISEKPTVLPMICRAVISLARCICFEFFTFSDFDYVVFN